MKNYITIDEQEEYLPALFVGVKTWPLDWHLGRETDDVVFWKGWGGIQEVPIPDINGYELLMYHQTAGHMCQHQQLFGYFFPIHDDRFEALINDYRDSGLAPYWVSYEELTNYRNKLLALGLDFHDAEYRHLQEAFLPCSPKLLYENIILKSDIKMLTPDRTLIAPPWSSFDELYKRLYDTYIKAAVPVGGENADQEMLRKIWAMEDLKGHDGIMGAIVFENCD